MKTRTIIFSLLVFLLTVSAAQAASIVTATSPQDAASLVYVSGYDLDPQVFYPYETGTITVHVTNAANASVGISQPDLIDPKIHILNRDTFSTMTNVGPGATADFMFLVTVDPPDGTYFPLFTVSPKVYNPIHATLKVKVDSTDIRASIAKKPDTFSLSKDTVNVSVVNPRDGDITDVLIIPEGSGVEVTPSESYVGTVKAGSSVQVPFQVTPNKQTDLTFHVSFRNGDNKHTKDVILPIVLGEDKMAAVPIINNIAVTSSGSNYQLTGDVNNAGISDAKSMVLTVNPPARAVEPYPEYAIGSLASDDFSSFELSFASNDLSVVPVKVSWKDADGNSFSTVKTLNLGNNSNSNGGSTGTGSSSSTASGSSSSRTTSSRTGGGFQGGPGGGSVFGLGGSRSGGLSAFYMPIGLGILVIVAVVLWIKRKWIAGKLKKK